MISIALGRIQNRCCCRDPSLLSLLSHIPLIPTPLFSLPLFSRSSWFCPNDREIMRSEGVQDAFTNKNVTDPVLILTLKPPPPQARIKAINTFFAKNSYGAVDSAVFTGSAQSRYSSPLYLQQVFQPQQYPIYSLLPHSWNPSPYFETPLVRKRLCCKRYCHGNRG